jgi:hypothetical protein
MVVNLLVYQVRIAAQHLFLANAPLMAHYRSKSDQLFIVIKIIYFATSIAPKTITIYNLNSVSEKFDRTGGSAARNEKMGGHPPSPPACGAIFRERR